MAESIQEAQAMLDMTAKNASLLIPGELSESFRLAWEHPQGPRQSFDTIVADLIGPLQSPAQSTKISDTHLREEGLFGAMGKFKRQCLSVLRDEVLRHLRLDKDGMIDARCVNTAALKAGLDSGGEYLEAAATFVKSVCP